MSINSKKENENKTSVEDRIVSQCKDKFVDINNSKSLFFYWTLIFLNIFTLVVALFWCIKEKNIVNYSIFKEGVSLKSIFLLIVIFIVIMCLYVLPMSLRLYNNTKRARFFTLYKANAVSKFFNKVTIYSKGENVAKVTYMSNHKINNKNSTSIAYGSKNFEDIAKCIYFLTIMIVGTFLGVANNIFWFYLIAFVALIYLIIKVGIRLIFTKNKELAVSLIAKFTKLLLSMKLIRDYDKFYNKYIDVLITYERSFKVNRFILFVEIVSNILIYFLKALILYFIVVLMNFGDVEILIDVLFKCVIIELLFNIVPLPNGLLFYEIIFIMLFKNIFFEGYLWWGMLLYRIFDYFIYAIHYLIILFIDFIEKKIKFSKNKRL